MSHAANEQAPFDPRYPSTSPLARLNRWARLLTHSRSISLTLASARLHATEPVLDFLALGGSLKRDGQCVTLSFKSFICAMPLSGLPAVALLARMLDAKVTVVAEEPEWRVRIPEGPVFYLDPDALASDIPVIALRFLDDEYGILDVSDQVVLDIGANIADSSIYFACRGARRVVAYEPFGATYRRAVRNVRANEMEKQISVVNKGVSSATRSTQAAYVPSTASGLSTSRRPDDGEVNADHETVHLISFYEAVNGAAMDSLDRIVCKVDCEGCEFEILNDPRLDQALERIQEILLEFHWRPPDPWLSRLTDAGFLHRVISQQPGVGLIHAVRNTDA